MHQIRFNIENATKSTYNQPINAALVDAVYPFVHKLRMKGSLAHAFLVLPWLIGLGYSFATTTALMKIVGGVCKSFGALPTKMASQAMGVLTFSVEYLLPLSVMVVCYSHMLKVRRD